MLTHHDAGTINTIVSQMLCTNPIFTYLNDSFPTGFYSVAQAKLLQLVRILLLRPLKYGDYRGEVFALLLINNSIYLMGYNVKF